MALSFHWSLLLYGAVAVGWPLLRHGWAGALQTVISIAALALALIVHECAHAVVARALGYRLLVVEFHPFGGSATLSGWISLRHEVILALAGPLASLIAAGAVWNLSAASPLAAAFGAYSLVLAVVNLVPCCPLDAGRVLLATLRIRLGPARGDRYAFEIGHVLSLAALALSLAAGQLLAAFAFAAAGLACRGHQRQLVAVRPPGPGAADAPGAGDVPPDDAPPLEVTDARAPSRPQKPALRVIRGGLDRPR